MPWGIGIRAQHRSVCPTPAGYVGVRQAHTPNMAVSSANQTARVAKRTASMNRSAWLALKTNNVFLIDSSCSTKRALDFARALLPSGLAIRKHRTPIIGSSTRHVAVLPTGVDPLRATFSVGSLVQDPASGCGACYKPYRAPLRIPVC
jgi:hypothetical protein